MTEEAPCWLYVYQDSLKHIESYPIQQNIKFLSSYSIQNTYDIDAICSIKHCFLMELNINKQHMAFPCRYGRNLLSSKCKLLNIKYNKGCQAMSYLLGSDVCVNSMRGHHQQHAYAQTHHPYHCNLKHNWLNVHAVLFFSIALTRPHCREAPHDYKVATH